MVCKEKARKLIEEQLNPKHHHLITDANIHEAIELNGKFEAVYRDDIWDGVMPTGHDNPGHQGAWPSSGYNYEEGITTVRLTKK